MKSQNSGVPSAEMTLYESGVGQELNRLVVRPEGAPVAAVMLAHGLGEHIERYIPIAEMLAKRGCVVTGVDIPGHGRSPGGRGHVGTWETVETIFTESVGYLRAESGGEVSTGLVAHSMGAFLGLRYLELHPEVFTFAWLSSPLLRPSEKASGMTRVWGRLLAKIMPGCTFDSGVRPSMCRVIPKDEEPDPFFHSRVSAGWGVDMWEVEAALYLELGRLNPELCLLMTQGDADSICPMEHACELFERIELRDKEWRLLEGELHEPLFGEQSAAVLEGVTRWLEDRKLILSC
jgi:lysophospholipase